MANIKVKIKEGQVFNRLTVMESIGKSKYGHLLYNCKCSCGNIKAVTGASLKRGEVQSCGCLKSENTTKMGKSRKGTSHLDKGDAGKNHLYLQYKHGAKKRNIEFKLTIEQVVAISSLNCYYCNVEPKQVINKESEIGSYLYNGIDRLDNTLGYTLDNCVPCCKVCNRSKSDMTIDEFYDWIKNVFETRFKD